MTIPDTHLHTHPHQLQASDIRQLYDSEVGTAYVNSAFFRERLMRASKMRRLIFAKAQGDILDVACGSGENFAYYNRPGNHYTGIEISPVMAERARERARNLDMNVDVQVMDAQQLEFPDHSFDTVVSALATCTFPDQIAALKEMKRVCKSGGRILLFEHGRSRIEFIGRWQDRVAPQEYATGGCRFNQKPEEVVKAAGLKIVWSKQALLGIVIVMEIDPSL
ncbi:MAG TPA: class I SAM-dependent methyltransferase [Phototrophicaceae bacterium]|jgi:ubiquinone/menaquinone biosynthesis C-methylase UbiE|nr:class I SAM-dependent methyltransferase [Phototrophicaceae bacterium]